jgi:RimJ/RimL family protein N-acetyltransferase
MRTESARILPELSDGIVTLRPFNAADAPALAAIWTDPAIRARNTVPEASEEAALDWIAARNENLQANVAWEWALVDGATKSLLGRRALKGIDWINGRAEAACWIAAGFRGHQFAARSLRLAAGFAFAQGLVRVQAEIESDNEASLRSVKAAGMHHEGTFRSYFVSNAGVRVDAEMYGLLEEDLLTAPRLRPHQPTGPR